jgi:hypothetical protein
MDTFDLGKPFLITKDGPKHDALAAKEPHDGPAANFYATSIHNYTQDATHHALYQLHSQMANTVNGIADAVAAPGSGAEEAGLGPNASAKIRAVGNAYGRVAAEHFDAERNNPHRVLNKHQFTRVERADGGHVNYKTDMS